MTGATQKSRRLIVIVGFMGAGKTTVARELARLLNCRSIDLDELISERERRTPGQIIEKSGEDEFRRKETEALREVLDQLNDDSSANIIALGGGAWIVNENRKLIAERDGFTVWLDAPFELCWQRIEDEDESRPLAHSREAAEKLMAERRSIYELADLRIAVSTEQTQREVALAIVNALPR